MLQKNMIKATILAALAAINAPVHAAIVISEVDANGSSASYGADWFELTNTGTSAVNISGWKMDDNSNSFAASVALRGVSSIGAGQSVIFLEGNSTGSTDATLDAGFKSAWFGSSVPAGFVIGNYGGSGVGLSATTDAVNIFDAGGATIARVDFNASTTGFTFDNKAGLNNVTISTLSAVGVNGGFTAAGGTEVGSPGAVPIPAAAWLFGSGFAGLLGLRRKKAAV